MTIANTLHPQRIEASFRDPSGHVYKQGNRIFRTIRSRIQKDYEVLRDAGVYEKLIKSGKLISTEEISFADFDFDDQDVKHVLEHRKLPLVTYPYEWPFSALKAAALFHLELQKNLLESDVVLCDASAYNIQFIGAKPLFIDFLSLRPYQEGEYWVGHRQFCEHFLFPLLVRAIRGITHNAWLRGMPDGIRGDDVVELIPLWSKLQPRMLLHLVLPQILKNRAKKKLVDGSSSSKNIQRLPKSAYRSMLNQLYNWIATLDAPKGKRSTWDDYTLLSSYSNEEVGEKIDFVKKFVQTVQPASLLDLGCNTGEYSELAILHGAKSVIGIDLDPHACDSAFARADTKGLDITVLQVDMTNPSPSQGWKGEEFQSLRKRIRVDGMVALAVLHHFVIGKNISLTDAVNCLLDLSPQGVIEFVDKSDEQVKKMLRFREDIFPDYTKDKFISVLKSRANIIEAKEIKQSHRLLVWYKCFAE